MRNLFLVILFVSSFARAEEGGKEVAKDVPKDVKEAIAPPANPPSADSPLTDSPSKVTPPAEMPPAAPPTQETTSFWDHVSLSAHLNGFTAQNSQQWGGGGGLMVGYYVSDRLQFAFGYGKIVAQDKTTGGDLAAWQYVERQYKIDGDAAVFATKFIFWESPKRRHAFSAHGSVGLVNAKASFDYARYKPYSGLICFSSCDKSLEESTSGSEDIKFKYVRVGAEYSFSIRPKRRITSHTFFTGAYFQQILDPQNRTVGTTRKDNVSTDIIGKGALSLGYEIRF